jgi:DNA invertase Pin-like site-specific DNA recombinase
MSGARLAPEQQQAALAMRAAGYSVAVIAERINVSVSTLKRLFKRCGVKKGSVSEELIEKATKELLEDAETVETVKREAATLLLDDLALSKQLRHAMAEATEKLIATDTAEALQVMRAVSSAAVALKSTSETVRKSLGLDKDDNAVDELPELTIRMMNNDEIEAVKEKARRRLEGDDNEFY